jgi:hypothetical protein
MMPVREADRIAGWIYLTDVDAYARSAEIGYGFRPHAHSQRFASLEEDGLHDVAILALLDDEI